MERVLYLGGAAIEPKGIIKHIVAKVDKVDSLTSEVSAKSTVLNLLPALGGNGKLTRPARTTKILKLAKETKIHEKLGVITAKNLEDVVKQVAGKKILSNKLLFDFTKK
jgi:hypothetical protein